MHVSSCISLRSGIFLSSFSCGQLLLAVLPCPVSIESLRVSLPLSSGLFKSWGFCSYSDVWHRLTRFWNIDTKSYDVLVSLHNLRAALILCSENLIDFDLCKRSIKFFQICPDSRFTCFIRNCSFLIRSSSLSCSAVSLIYGVWLFQRSFVLHNSQFDEPVCIAEVTLQTLLNQFLLAARLSFSTLVFTDAASLPLIASRLGHLDSGFLAF